MSVQFKENSFFFVELFIIIVRKMYAQVQKIEEFLFLQVNKFFFFKLKNIMRYEFLINTAKCLAGRDKLVMDRL